MITRRYTDGVLQYRLKNNILEYRHDTRGWIALIGIRPFGLRPIKRPN